MDRAEQVHDRGRIRAAHAEVDQGDAVGGRVRHGPVGALDRHAVPLGEDVDVVAEIGQQDVLAELVERGPGIARQPVADDVVLFLHACTFETVSANTGKAPPIAVQTAASAQV